MDKELRRVLAKKYNGMKQRCYNQKNSEYRNYGGRCIYICDEWLSNPEKFFEWAASTGYKNGLTIDRIDVDKGYSPNNCRWVTMAEQQANKRSNVFVECNGETIDVAPVQKWISVKDRLPEAGGYVVCIAKRNPFSRFMPMVAKIERNGWVNPITEQYISDVSHWMPIPEPPEEE